MDEPRLSVVVDGAPMAADEARAFWGRFSAYMEAHHGDLQGFAAAEGFASVHPETGPEGAVLVVSRTAKQRPYAAVVADEGGSDANHPDHLGEGSNGGGSRKTQGKRHPRR